MKSSNLAWRLEPEEAAPRDALAPAATAEPPELRARHEPPVRRSFGYRAIVIRDQGLKSFRVC